jgi:glycosyltransferase involved in cell wall biosynthesis
MKFSVVIPVYNEEGNIQPLVAELDQMVNGGTDIEVFLVDDGSRDSTWQKITAASKAFPFIKGIRSIRNRGQSAAMLLGLSHATGDVVVTMDGDLQNNPADIPKLVEEMGDYDVVCGYRAKRRDTWSKKVGSKIGNAIRNRITKDNLRDTGCSLKAFKRKCISDLPPLNGAHRFMGAYFKLNGRSIKQIPVDHRARQFGQSKYTNLKRLPKTMFDLIGFVWYRSRLLKPNAEIEVTGSV